MQSRLCRGRSTAPGVGAYHAYFFINGSRVAVSVRKEKVLLDPQQRDPRAKRVLADTDPSDFFPAAAGLGHKILRILTKGPNYPSMIARELKLYHQAVYYHMKKLEAAGLVKRVSERTVRGGKAQLYALASDGYAVEFDVRGEEFGLPASLSTAPKGGTVITPYSWASPWGSSLASRAPSPSSSTST
jgi:DNA-binding transcriptional ArsR family regulator